MPNPFRNVPFSKIPRSCSTRLSPFGTFLPSSSMKCIFWACSTPELSTQTVSCMIGCFPPGYTFISPARSASSPHLTWSDALSTTKTRRCSNHSQQMWFSVISKKYESYLNIMWFSRILNNIRTGINLLKYFLKKLITIHIFFKFLENHIILRRLLYIFLKLQKITLFLTPRTWSWPNRFPDVHSHGQLLHKSITVPIIVFGEFPIDTRVFRNGCPGVLRTKLCVLLVWATKPSENGTKITHHKAFPLRFALNRLRQKMLNTPYVILNKPVSPTLWNIPPDQAGSKIPVGRHLR